MKKTMMKTMFIALVAMAAGCTADDPFSDSDNSWGNDDLNGGTSGGQSGSGSSSTSGELTTFAVAIDKTSAEPTSTATEYFPDEEDALENNSFATEVAIDMANPTATTVGGVVVTVNGGHVVADHGSVKGICYVVSGTTTNGSLTIVGDKKYAVKLNNANITNPDSAALNLLSSKRAYVVLADGTVNTLADGPGGTPGGWH